MTQNKIKSFITKANDPSYQYENSDIDRIAPLLLIHELAERANEVIYIGAIGRGNIGLGTTEIDYAKEKILKVLNEYPTKEKFVGIYNTGSNHWISFIIFRSLSHDTISYQVFFKDSLGEKCQDFHYDINKILEENGSRVSIFSFNGKEQILEFEPYHPELGINVHANCGIFAIKNMLVIAGKIPLDLSSDMKGFFLSEINNENFGRSTEEKAHNYKVAMHNTRREFATLYVDHGPGLEEGEELSLVHVNIIENVMPSSNSQKHNNNMPIPVKSTYDSVSNKQEIQDQKKCELYPIQKPEDKKVSDINRLKQLIGLIDKELKKDIIDLSSIKIIGSILHDISWDQEDPNCIRNLHGYRNRYKAKNNSLNENIESAKIDFETLSHLQTITNHNFFTNIREVKSSLQDLRHKIDLILQQEKITITENEKYQSHGVLEKREESDFLRKIASYSHDIECLGKLRELLNAEHYNILTNLNLVLTIDRYWFGYFCVQIGETAKELSEFIKVDHDIKELFSILGYYRQIVKNSPYIVSDRSNTQLQQMKNSIQNVFKNLAGFLSECKTTLEKENTDRPPYENYSSITKQALQSLDQNNPTIKEILTAGTTDLKHHLQHKIAVIEKELKVFQDHLEQLQIDLNVTTGKDVNRTISQPDKYKKYKKFSHYIEEYKKSHPAEITIAILKKNIEEESERIKLLDETIKVKKHSYKVKKQESDKLSQKDIEDEKQIKMHYELLSLDNILSELDKEKQFNLHEMTISRFMNLLNQNGKEHIELECRINEKKQLIEKHKQKLLEAQKELKNFSTTENDTSVLEEWPSLLLNDKDDEISQMLQKVTHEVHILTLMHSLQDTIQYVYASKMSAGFIGEYCNQLKRLSDTNSSLQEFTNIMLQECISIARVTRSKHIMHDPLNPVSSTHVKNTIKEWFIPCHQDFNSLSTIYKINNPQGYELVIVAQAFIRLGKYDTAIAALNKADETIEREHKLRDFNFTYNPEDKGSQWIDEFVASLPSIKELMMKLQTSIEQFGLYSYDKIKVLELIIDCHIAKKDFSKAQDIIEDGIRIVDSIFSFFSVDTTAPPQSNNPFLANSRIYQNLCKLLSEKPSLEKNPFLVFAIFKFRLDKFDVLKNLNRNKEAYKVLKDLEHDINEGKYGSGDIVNNALAKIYYEFALSNSEDAHYLDLLQNISKNCSEGIIIGFNIIGIKYNNAIRSESTRGLQSVKDTARELKKYFSDHEKEFKQYFGEGYNIFKIEVMYIQVDSALFHEKKHPQEISQILKELTESFLKLKQYREGADLFAQIAINNGKKNFAQIKDDIEIYKNFKKCTNELKKNHVNFEYNYIELYEYYANKYMSRENIGDSQIRLWFYDLLVAYRSLIEVTGDIKEKALNYNKIIYLTAYYNQKHSQTLQQGEFLFKQIEPSEMEQISIIAQNSVQRFCREKLKLNVELTIYGVPYGASFVYPNKENSQELQIQKVTQSLILYNDQIIPLEGINPNASLVEKIDCLTPTLLLGVQPKIEYDLN